MKMVSFTAGSIGHPLVDVTARLQPQFITISQRPEAMLASPYGVMTMYRALILGICLLPSLAAASIDCESCEAWNADQAPFQIFGNTYYVGVRGLSSVLITSADGHILLDGALPQSAPLIAHHVEQLGFKMSDVKIILNSHVHYDHAGGIAKLQKLSGAKVIASDIAGEGSPNRQSWPRRSAVRILEAVSWFEK